jgi:HSP20 family protein
MARFLSGFFHRDSKDPSNSLMNDFERALDEFTQRSRAVLPAWAAPGALAPRMDMSESNDAVEIVVELPGVEEGDIDVSISDGVLTIKGEKKVEREATDKNWRIVERGYGSFTRSIPLGFEPKSDKVEASFNQGLLTIRMPKPAEAIKKPQKVKIKGSKAA